jgi:hypothetical protein
MQNEPMQNTMMRNRTMQKATVICITQGRNWAGPARFPQTSAAERAWLLGIAIPIARPARRMKIVYRRNTNLIRGKAKFAIGLANGVVV